MIRTKVLLLFGLVVNLSIDQATSKPSPLFDPSRGYSNFDEISTKCTKICRASNGIVHIEGDECRCKIETANPAESVDLVLRRAGREGLNLVPRRFPRFRRSPCMGVLGFPRNPSLAQQRLRAYGVGMLAPILGISPDQVNVLVSDIMSNNGNEPIMIGQPRDKLLSDDIQEKLAQITNNNQVSNEELTQPIENTVREADNQPEDVVSSMIETIPARKTASDFAIDGDSILGSQRIVPIVGGSQVPSASVIGTEQVDGPIVSPFKT